MVGGRASNTNTNTIDEDDDIEICRKMKSLNQLEDAVVDTHKHHEEEEEEDDEDQDEEEEEEEEDEEEEEEVEGEVVRPIGDVVRVSNEGGNVKKHFKSFEFDGVRFHLEDPVLVTPEEEKAKPSVAIIKDIFQTKDGELMISGQRFYRPEEAEKEKGGTWQRHDPRELFYSWHRDDLPADSVMHRCIIHLVPLPKPMPNRKLHPGFVVRKVYDSEQRRLRDITDRECTGSLIKRGTVESV